MNVARGIKNLEQQGGISTHISRLSNGVSKTVLAITLAACTTLVAPKKVEAQSQAACVLTGPVILPCAAVTTAGTIIVFTISGLTILIDRISRGEIMLAPQPHHSGVYICRGINKNTKVVANSITRACALTPPEFYECGADQGHSTRYFTCVGGGTPGREDYLPGY